MMLPLFIIIPLIAAFLITLIAGKKDVWGIVLSVVASAAMLILAVISFLNVNGETIIYEMGNWKMPFGIALVLDSLSGYMLIIVNLVALTAIIYSIQYIRHLGQDFKYYALFMLMLTGMNGVILTGDIFNLYVFMEIALFAAFALVAYGCRAEEYEAAFKYAVMGSVSSIFILIGIGVLYSATSTLTMARIAQTVPNLSPQIILWVGGLFLAGFGLKAAAMPFHAWLPDAHSSAPAPISSMLSGVLIKVLGIYTITRIFFNVLDAPAVFLTIFIVIGTISILISGFLAIIQWDFKRLLAYSSISQIGYILLGIGLATPLGILGAVFHLFNHAIFKSLLFYDAGSVELALGTRDLQKLGKLGKLLPVTSGTSIIASLAISGIPPFNGFFSKLIIIIAAIAAGQPVLALLAILGSILTLAAVMKIQCYGLRQDVDVEPREKIGLGMNIAMISLAIICIVGGLLVAPGIREVALDPVVNVILEKAEYVQTVLGR
ncbi:NADH/ubiquinone/plastoquinone (complex I) [candidate division KSB1 bacterium]|nr:NADH/ubiquinone/plastoquinone (complex I) [candidate division KSB1 bacterium]RQW02061.1 MAG: NADH/ubiquinone/plastoquinone (complex I) [candidate division KSB1 bacterium]